MDQSIIETIYYFADITFLCFFAIYFFWELKFILIALVCNYSEITSNNKSKFLLVICAKNEEKVLHRAINSIKNQNYPQKLIEVLLVADNCIDNTVNTAKKYKIDVINKVDNKTGKGFALDIAFKHALKHYSFDAIIVLDADNTINPSFVEHMNNSLNSKKCVVAPFRNSKTFNSSICSACNAIWFLRDAGLNNMGHHSSHNQCTISGSGFAISKEVVQNLNGYPFHTLLEDFEFSAYACYKNIKISYNDYATLYDYENGKVKNFNSQHTRWLRGLIQVFKRTFPQVFIGIFNKNTFKYCIDLFIRIFTVFLLVAIQSMLLIFSIIISLIQINYAGTIWCLELQNLFFAIILVCLLMLLFGFCAIIKYWDRIKATSKYKITAILCYPFGQLLNVPFFFKAIFQKAKWKKISR